MTDEFNSVGDQFKALTFSTVDMEPGEEGGGVESTQTNGNELVDRDEEVRLQFKLLNERESVHIIFGRR